MKEKFWDILCRHKGSWVRPQSGGVDVQYDIVPTSEPVKDRLRPLNDTMKAVLDKELDAMYEGKVIQDSTSPWGSNVVIVKKADGNWRVCVDYRKVNKVIKNDAYPVPHLVNSLQQIAHHLWYIEIDLFWGFWNIRLSKRAREVTAFLSHRGLHEFVVLPFGLKVSPGGFQRVMDNSFLEFYGKGILVYFDNIILYANSLSELFVLFELALERCARDRFAVRLEKMKLCWQQLKSLGHVVSSEGITADPKKVEALFKCVAPKTKEELRSFLGTVGYLRRFVPSFSELALPLTELMKSKVPFEWNDLRQESFEV